LQTSVEMQNCDEKDSPGRLHTHIVHRGVDQGPGSKPRRPASAEKPSGAIGDQAWLTWGRNLAPSRRLSRGSADRE
jgi:hypothetical protein